MSDLYHATLKSLAERARGRPPLDRADASATVDNPLCGDRVTIQLALAGDRIVAVGHVVRGCLLCEAAATLLAETVPGRSTGELVDLAGQVRAYLAIVDEPEPVAGLAAFAPARAHRARHRCVSLPFEALAKALT